MDVHSLQLYICKIITHINQHKIFSGSEMAVSMLNYLDAAKIDYSSIQVVGCDGTNSNTGWKVSI